MEKEIKIPIEGNKNIYGTLRGDLNRPIVIFVHGFTGYRNEHLFFNGAQFLDKNGYSSFRFNLYGWEEDARKLHECLLRTHSDDLDVVVDYFYQQGAKKIYVIGHSFGGPTILFSKKKNFNGIVLWDPTNSPSFVTADKGPYVEEIDSFVDVESDIVVGKKMINEIRNLNFQEPIKTLTTPYKIICAGAGVLAEKWETYINDSNAYGIIPGASHCFDEEGTERLLFSETLDFLNKINI